MNTLPKIFSAFSLTILLSACPGSGGDSSSTTTTYTTIYGLAYDAVNAKLYIANGRSNSVSVIDTTKNIRIKAVPVGNTPWGVQSLD